MSDTQVLDRPAVAVTASAAKRIAEILKEDGTPGMMLRIAVSGGGCSGFQYGFTLDDARADDDLAVVRDGVTVLVDSVSVEYMQGAEVDFVEDMIGASFQIKNPNATSKCGCGSSFSV
jgi:iron-sulfur cluster insertion protein